MQVKTEVIVLSALRYQEKSLIVKCFSKDFGLQTYFVRNAFSKRNKGLNSAYFQPLTQLFIDATHKNKGNLEYINDLRLAYPYQTVSTDFYKNSVCIFLAEVLSASIKEPEAHTEFFLFIKTALIWFDEHEFTPDFHLWFLFNITKYLGFFPDDSDVDALYFNPDEGSFTMHYTPNCFGEDETGLLRRLFQIKPGIQKSPFRNPERRTLLKLLLQYYETHVTGFRHIRSIEIMPELFQ